MKGATDLGRQYEGITLLLTKQFTEAQFAKAAAIPRRRILVSHARIPGGFERGPRLHLRNALIYLAQRHATGEARAAKPLVPRIGDATFDFLFESSASTCR